MPSQLASDSSSQLNLAWSFHENVLARPASAALWIEGNSITYAKLGERAARIASWLGEEEIGRGARVGVLARSSVQAYAGILGACWSGATYVPLDPRNPEARLAELVRRAELSALIVDAAGAAALGPALLRVAPRHVLVPDSAADGIAHAELVRESRLERLIPTAVPAAVREDDTAYLMFTSGTTGVPKGVMVSAGNVAHLLRVMQERYRLRADDRCSQFFELTFDLSVFDLFMTWGAGACLHPCTEAERLAPAKFVRDHAISIWFAVPSVIAFMARVKALPPNTLPSLRLSLFCGEALPAESARLWREAAPASALENLYGPTEATVACLVEPCTESIRVTQNRGTVAIGAPFDGTFAAIVDGEGRFLPRGEIGELALSGAQIAAGYWRDGELSRASFPTLDHPEWGSRTFYLTRDLAVQDSEGRFHFLGRADNQVKIHGHRVELEEIDAHLAAITQATAAAIAWPVPNGSSAEGVVAFVTGVAPHFDEIRQRMRDAVPWYMVPRRIVRLDALPLTANGKVDRKALKKMLESESSVAR